MQNVYRSFMAIPISITLLVLSLQAANIFSSKLVKWIFSLMPGADMKGREDNEERIAFDQLNWRFRELFLLFIVTGVSDKWK